MNITQIMQEFCMTDIIYFYTYRVYAVAIPENSMRYLHDFQALKSADMPYNPDQRVCKVASKRIKFFHPSVQSGRLRAFICLHPRLRPGGLKTSTDFHSTVHAGCRSV
jgi:hypothetical protein